MLDTLRTAQTLKTAGFPPAQAEATAQVLGDALADVATKSDLDGLESRVDAKFDALNGKINLLIGFVTIMLASVFGFAFLAMATPNTSWNGPPATATNPTEQTAPTPNKTPPPANDPIPPSPTPPAPRLPNPEPPPKTELNEEKKASINAYIEAPAATPTLPVA